MANVVGAQIPAGPTTGIGSKRDWLLSVGSGLVLIFAACLIWSPKLSAIASMFLRLQLSVDIPPGNGTHEVLSWADRDWYCIGAMDIFTLACYTVVAMIVTTIFEDTLGTKFLLKNAEDPREMSRLSINLIFNMLSFVHVVAATWNGHFGAWAIWNGYPNSHMPFLVKLFFLVQVSYYVHALIYNRTMKPEDADDFPSAKQINFHLAMLFLAAIARNSLMPILIVLMIPNSLLSFIHTLALICERATPDNVVLNICLDAIYKYVTLAEYIWLLAASVLMCCFGESNPIVLRMFIVIASLFWGIVGVLTFVFQLEQGPQRAPSRGGAGRANTPSSRKPKAAKSGSRRRQ